jgi:hypothetical protein
MKLNHPKAGIGGRQETLPRLPLGEPREGRLPAHGGCSHYRIARYKVALPSPVANDRLGGGRSKSATTGYGLMPTANDVVQFDI